MFQHSFYKKQVGLLGNGEMKPMYVKAAPIILGMKVAMKLSFDKNCDLKKPNVWLNIAVRLCSAVAVLT
jgi:hypothetical protein